MSQSPSLPRSFISKKKKILSQLSIPVEEYDDFSPKGSVDVGIRELIDEINAREGLVTTSSCAGRLSVYLDGVRSTSASSLGQGKNEIGTVGDVRGEHGEEDGEAEGERKAGGKGGGRWLFVSHDPVDVGKLEGDGCLMLFGLNPPQSDDERALTCSSSAKETRLIHFKFEPMILHVLTGSTTQAQTILSAALQAGFRESGALNILPPFTTTNSSQEPATPMVGIRSMGLALESIIGFERDGEMKALVPEWQLRWLVGVANERFVENGSRIGRFKELLSKGEAGGKKGKGKEGGWEESDVRRERMRREGKERAEAFRVERERVKVNGGRAGKWDEGPDIECLGI